jgi:hypothetical protein
MMQQGLVPQCYSRQEVIVATQEHFQQPAGKKFGATLADRMEFGIWPWIWARIKSKLSWCAAGRVFQKIVRHFGMRLGQES